MDKRYQVFISSTFADLEEERKGIMEAIIELDCFPAGMEMFPATDTAQFEYIKTIIDESDYYVLIIAGRYGSVAEDGISYTEKEFDYAREKGVPILAFVKKDIDNIPVNKTDQDPKKRKKLDAFRSKALNGRMANFWNTADELKYKLHSSLSKEFKIHPREGWVRGNNSKGEGLIERINELKDENNALKDQNKKLKKDTNIDTLFGVDIHELKRDFFVFYNVWEDETEECGELDYKIKLSLYDVIKSCGKSIINEIKLFTFKRVLSDTIICEKANDGKNEEEECNITDQSLEDIKLRLLAYGLVYTDYDQVGDEVITLTDSGQQVLFYIVKNEKSYWVENNK